jgi:hypothetical protein
MRSSLSAISMWCRAALCRCDLRTRVGSGGGGGDAGGKVYLCAEEPIAPFLFPFVSHPSSRRLRIKLHPVTEFATRYTLLRSTIAPSPLYQ